MIIGYIVGVFDQLHYGHKNMIIEGLMRCDRLVIGIHTDEFAKSYKRLPSQNEKERKKKVILFLNTLVNYQNIPPDTDIPLIDDNHIILVKKFGINKILHGDDWDLESYKKQIKYYKHGMDKMGVEIELIPYSKGISTTLILNNNIKYKLKDKKCFLFDLDNTLILNGKPKKFAHNIVSKLNNNNREIYIVTNNNRYTPESIHKLLKRLSINIPLKNIITTLTVISNYLKQNNYSQIYVWGTQQAKNYFSEQGFKFNNPEIVIVLYCNEFNYKDLIELVGYTSKIPYVIGNIDRNYPDQNLILPDTGCLWKYIEYCCNKKPLSIFGKPNNIMLSDINQKYKNEDIIFIGDSNDTDKELAKRSNIDFIKVHDKDGDISHLGVLCDFF